MAGCMHRAQLQCAEWHVLAVGKQMIELTAITSHRRFGIEQCAKDLLHRLDVLTDTNLATEMFFQVRRGRQVIGMDMGFQYPLDRGTQFAHPGDQLVGAGGAGMTGLAVVIEHAVDQCALTCRGVECQIADGSGGLIEEAFNLKGGRADNVFHACSP